MPPTKYYYQILNQNLIKSLNNYQFTRNIRNVVQGKQYQRDVISKFHTLGNYTG